MNTKKLKVKLSLNKQTISNMTMTNLRGGITIHYLPTDAPTCGYSELQPGPILAGTGCICPPVNYSDLCVPASNGCDSNPICQPGPILP